MSQPYRYHTLIIAMACLSAARSGSAAMLRCPSDSVRVGNVCIDKYEASVWDIPPSNTALIRRVQLGRVTVAELTNGGATELSPSQSCSPAFPATFGANGNWTKPVYAVSIPGVRPAGCVTWLQAEQACALAGKRLLTNQEWQRAAAGTPDPGADDGETDCNVGGLNRPVEAGSRSKCVSSWGTFDMVGNVEEWVADWVAQTTACPGWGSFSDDVMCLSGANTTGTGPGALVRGGSYTDFTAAGVFAIDAGPARGTIGNTPVAARPSLGFRCAR